MCKLTIQKMASELLSLLDTLNLTQHVQGPTHFLGHTLDLVKLSR